MDDLRIDLPTRRRFARLAAGLAAALTGLTALHDSGARKKRNKKRKSRPKEICRELREECGSSPKEQCCGNLVCDDNTCVSDPVCLRPAGGPCRDKCDCRLGLECSTRANSTCRQCVLLQNPCEDHDDCCLATAACGSTIFATDVCCQQLGNACGLDSDCCANTGKCGLVFGGTEPVCCTGAGFPCVDNGDCCDPLRCPGGTCQ
jgi:hypothetical protein